MAKSYDIIVIGAGAGGLGVALGMAKFGFRVLMIDRRAENFGGECLNSGCVPSKALIHVADIIHKNRQAADYGLSSSGKLDFKKLMAYVHQRQDIIRQHENPQFLEEQEGIESLIGEASFAGKNEVEVSGQRYRAKRIVVATGSKPRVPDVPGLKRVKFLTNENLFELKELPQRLLIVGGGPIGVEMSQTFSRLGSKVLVLETKDRILGKEPSEAADIVQQQLEKEGVVFKLNHKLERLSHTLKYHVGFQ